MSSVIQDVEDVIAAASSIIMATRRAPRRNWIRPSLRAKTRYSGSALLGELRTVGGFKNFLASSGFEHLILQLGPEIAKTDTNRRLTHPIKEKLALIMRFLAEDAGREKVVNLNVCNFRCTFEIQTRIKGSFSILPTIRGNAKFGLQLENFV